jgi:hypothetical protein
MRLPVFPLSPRARVLIGFLATAALAWLGFAPSSPVPDDLHDFVAGMACGFAAVGGLVLIAWSIRPLRERMANVGCDSSVPALRRRYLREFLPAMAAYAVAIVGSTWLLKHVDEPVLRALLALLPVPPVAFAVRAIARYIRDSDELQRRIELEAVSASTALVSLLYLAAGLLQIAKVIDLPAGPAMFWVFPMLCLGYGVAKGIIAWRYR